MPGYRFANFTLSPKRRLLMRAGRELPLIPRYFDLLVLLIERRHEAVHRREIFDRVWGDVVVSDTALNQAIRTIRRTLDDDSREPRYVRTVARHGYRFVYDEVIETEEEALMTAPPVPVAAPPEPATESGEIDALIARVTAPAHSEAEEEDKREAAEMLHALGTDEALKRLGTQPGHASARALLRDTRWDVPGAGDVPVIGAPGGAAAARKLIAIRLRRASRIVARRWASGSIGGGVAGAAAGAFGGLILAAMPDSGAPAGVAPALAVIGGGCGALGGAGVGAGLAMAEATARSARTIALVIGAALGGALVGTAVQWTARWTLAALVGLRVEIGGGLEGIVIGAAAGLGYALATRQTQGGMAAPRGRRRLRAALITAALCSAGALALTLLDRPLVGGTIHLIARAAEGSQVSLAPLGRLVGEPDFGRLTRAIIGAGEGAVFGLGLALGLMRR